MSEYADILAQVERQEYLMSLRDQTIAQLRAQVATLTAERNTAQQRATVLDEIATRAAQERDYWKEAASDALDARDRYLRERDVASGGRDTLRATLREVARAQPLCGTLGEHIDVQMPTRVWLTVKALEGRDAVA